MTPPLRAARSVAFVTGVQTITPLFQELFQQAQHAAIASPTPELAQDRSCVQRVEALDRSISTTQ